jgi:hypothetical protein
MHGFSAGRRPKPKVLRTTLDDNEDDLQNVTSATESMEIETPVVPVIKRLNRPGPSKSSGSKLKLSFGADEVGFHGYRLTFKEAEKDETFVPKRSVLSKKVTESKGRKFGLQAYISSASKFNPSHALPVTATDTAATLSSRPSYTKDYLSQLRDSTPSTPRDTSRYLSDDSPDFANSIQTTARPAEILDEAVVRALKERRRDRAKGEDYLAISDDDTKSHRRRDSDDDDYKSYVDESVPLQKDMEAAQIKHKKAQIQEALYRSDSEEMSGVSEDEWENQQIAKTQPGLVKVAKRNIHAMPDEILAVPVYATALARLKGHLLEMQTKRGELMGVVEQLDKESEEIKEREIQVQEGLARAGREYEMLREEFRGSGANRGLDEVGEFGPGQSAMQM